MVTGGTAGIGLGIARAFAAEGARVTLVGRDATRAREAAAQWSDPDAVRVVIGDVADPAVRREAVDLTVAAFGGLDVLVNNAGTTVRGRPEDYALDDYAHVLDVNLTAAFAMSQLA